MPRLIGSIRSFLLMLAVTVVAPATPGRAAAPALPPTDVERLEVFPSAVVLDGPRAFHRLGVMSVGPNGVRRDVHGRASYRSTVPGVAAVGADGFVRPVADGTAVISIVFGGRETTVPVTVKRAAAEVPVDFSREVEPVLTRHGCNQGACHGSQHGKGGFRLSLLGFDPLFDYPQIVQSAEGRRVVLSDPERSILLAKPSLLMEHAGGERLSKSSAGYALMLRWLDDGAPEPKASDPTVTKLTVWPPRRIMVPGESQRLIVQAVWSDGAVADVTGYARFDTLNDSVVTVTPDGVATAHGAGESFVMVRFGGQADVVPVTLPFTATQGAATVKANNFIDEKAQAKWRELGLTPSPVCDDAEFFRRIHLDTIGLLPAPAEVKAFLADPDPTKREKAIDRVLNRPEFVDYWALKWGDLLLINRETLQEKGMWSFHNWVRAALRENKPVDGFAREILTAVGSRYTEGPVNFYANGKEWSESVAQVFLGVRMQCAKCHHHPFEKWSQDDYYGLHAYFVRMGAKSSQEFGLFGGDTVVFLQSGGEASHPRKGGVVKPKPPDGPAADDPVDRRRKLADWLTDPANPFFARNIVNRFWGYYLGRGLVEPLDDMRTTNPATNAELLDALAKDFVAHKFDLKHLLRTIMGSRVYQLTALVAPGNAADAGNLYCARANVRRLTAEQLADALDSATGTREKYAGLPAGTRAAQLPDTLVKSDLLDLFGRPARKVSCECERTTKPNMAQALHLLNGDFLNRKIADPKGRVEQLVQAKAAPQAVIEELYLATLSRPPRAEELSAVRGMLAAAKSPRDGAQDLLWVLINSREFQFNH